LDFLFDLGAAILASLSDYSPALHGVPFTSLTMALHPHLAQVASRCFVGSVYGFFSFFEFCGYLGPVDLLLCGSLSGAFPSPL